MSNSNYQYIYPLVVPPGKLNKSFDELGKKEVQKYFDWFIEIIPQRIDILSSAVQLYAPTWKADKTKESFVYLFDWFKSGIKSRLVTEQELKTLQEQLSKTPALSNVIEIGNRTFTNESVSICFDTAIYFGETLRNNINGLSWGVRTTSKKYIEYGQPIIQKTTGRLEVNPRRVIEVIGEKILDGTSVGNEFTNLLDVWMDMFKK